MASDKTLRDLREKAGLTQEELSERCRAAGVEIPQTRISEYELGTRFPPMAKVEALAAALGVKPERLFLLLLNNQKKAAA